MIEGIERPDLNIVIEDMIASEPALDAAAVRRWIARYPEYEREIMDFAAQWSSLTHLPPDDSPLESEENFYARGLEAVRKVIENKHAAKELISTREETPITSLLAEGERRGLPMAKLAAATELSVPLIAKFEQRLIAFSSIPREAIEAVARALNRSRESVAAYLQTGPSFAAGASYKSETAPELSQPQDFFAAVRSDRTIADRNRKKWLSLAPSSHDSK